jgi:histidine ammonia-lyase
MGGFASRKARQLIENAAYISAIELLLVLNAKDYLSLSSSPVLERIMGKVKEKIAPLTVDRYYAPDVEIAKQFLF